MNQRAASREHYFSIAVMPPGGPEENHMTRFALAAALAVAVAGTAYAQATEYYVVQDTTTKKCTIVDKKPTTTTVTQVGPVTFKTRQEAESGMKTIKVCETK
jgi:hypothetical protein